MSGSSISRRDALKSGLAAGLGGWIGRTRPTAPPPSADDDLDALLRELIDKHHLPGAIVGLYRDGKITAAAAGVANLNTGVPMTPDTAFLTGSITKVWTSTLVMTLVDEGVIDLDRPLIEYLPEFRLGDSSVTKILTARHLLNHSSGIDAGDLLLEVGEGPESHRRYVEALAQVGQIHAPGAYSSYCNGGFIIAGHLAESVMHGSWDGLLRQRVIAPLGLTRTVTNVDDAVLQRLAIGSVPDPKRPGSHMATPKLLLPKSAAPAGATLITTVQDNLEFAAMHLRRGTARDGRRVLSEASARAMATRTIGRPAGGGGFGLGWGTSGRPGATRLSHSGGSNGGIAQLVALPEAGIAYAAFANSSLSYGFHGELQRRVLATVLPIEPNAGAAAAPAPAGPELDRRRVVGSYRRKTQIITLSESDGRLMVDIRMIPEESEWSEAYLTGQPRSFEVVPSGPTELISREPVLLGMPATYAFLEPASDGRFQLLYSAGRLSRRTT